MKNFIGRAPFSPLFFYSGKIAGYLCWLTLLLLISGIEVIEVSGGSVFKWVAYVFLGIGLILTIISLLDLGSSVRFGLPTDETTLRTKGIYRFSRNPMYTGFYFLTMASMFYTLHFLIVILGVISLICYHSIIKAEERFLEERFGNEYFEYKRQTPRYFWIN